MLKPCSPTFTFSRRIYCDIFDFWRAVPTSAKWWTNYWHVRGYFVPRRTIKIRADDSAMKHYQFLLNDTRYIITTVYDHPIKRRRVGIFIIGNELFRSLILRMKGPRAERYNFSILFCNDLSAVVPYLRCCILLYAYTVRYCHLIINFYLFIFFATQRN